MLKFSSLLPARQKHGLVWFGLVDHWVAETHGVVQCYSMTLWSNLAWYGLAWFGLARTGELVWYGDLPSFFPWRGLHLPSRYHWSLSSATKQQVEVKPGSCNWNSSLAGWEVMEGIMVMVEPGFGLVGLLSVDVFRQQPAAASVAQTILVPHCATTRWPTPSGFNNVTFNIVTISIYGKLDQSPVSPPSSCSTIILGSVRPWSDHKVRRRKFFLNQKLLQSFNKECPVRWRRGTMRCWKCFLLIFFLWS